MGAQLKRGLLDVCVLSAIKNEDSYGYKIIKDLSPYIALSESTLYTILRRLELAKILSYNQSRTRSNRGFQRGMARGNVNIQIRNEGG